MARKMPPLPRTNDLIEIEEWRRALHAFFTFDDAIDWDLIDDSSLDITGTTANIFTLDYDDTGGNVDLVFGTLINKHLRHTGAEFQFDDDLTVTGIMNATTVIGANVTSGANPGHTHTGGSLSEIDISDDTNLTVTSPITLTLDDIGFDFSTNNTWTGTFKHQNASDSTTAFQVLDADGGNPVLNVDTTNEMVGIGTVTPTEKLSVIGNLLITDTEADSTNKVSQIVSMSYDSDEENVSMLDATMTQGRNTIRWGGGNNSFNATTQHDFYASPINVTSGTIKFRIQEENLIHNPNNLDYDFIIRDDVGELARFNAGTYNLEFNTNKKVQFRDSAIHIASLTDGHLDLTADVSIDMNALTDFGTNKAQFRDSAIGIYSQADTFLDLFADGSIRLGDSSGGAPTNYSEFESDGTLKFNGTATVWEDLRTPVSALRLPASNPPTAVIYKGGSVLAFASSGSNKIVQFEFQLSHTYKQGSDISIHAHWVLPTSGAGGGAENVKWDLTYSWANINSVFPAETSDTITVDVQNDVVDDHMFDAFTTISGAGKNISSVLLCSLSRDITVADDYADDVYLVEVDVHYEKDTIGSRQIGTK